MKKPVSHMLRSLLPVLLGFALSLGGALSGAWAQQEGRDPVIPVPSPRDPVAQKLKPVQQGEITKGNKPSINDAVRSGGGLNLLERMGAPLPDLPPEKPYRGAVDEAYGAYQRGLYLTAMNLALPKAQAGDPAAQTLVAEVMQNGLGVKRDRKGAAFWYGQAAEKGDPAAMFKYSLILLDGELVTRDTAKSEELMRKAADRGNAQAQFNYAQALVAGAPGTKGLKAALPYYEKAAAQGVVDAQYAVSQLYLNLEDIDAAKKAEARLWLTRAASSGYDTAQFDLAMWYLDGTVGDQNLEEGFRWMRRAAEGGHVAAQNRLAHLYINALGTRPDPIEATKWYLLSRQAGLKDELLDDFYDGLTDEQQKAGQEAAGRHRAL